jgi:hypothetical protein
MIFHNLDGSSGSFTLLFELLFATDGQPGGVPPSRIRASFFFFQLDALVERMDSACVCVFANSAWLRP